MYEKVRGNIFYQQSSSFSTLLDVADAAASLDNMANHDTRTRRNLQLFDVRLGICDSRL